METIKLDLVPGKKMPSLHASQYDDGREHGIDLFENGVVYKLDGTETLTINERKGDNCICSLDIENTFADSNHIVFASTEQMCAVWGNNLCELVIAKGDVSIGTLNFILEIEPSPTENGIESESEIKNLKRQIEAITEEVIGDDYYTAEETDEAIATATEDINNKIASEYDEEETYYRGDIVLYNGVLYECDNTDASGEFNPSDWKEITLGEGIENVRDLLADYYTKSQSDYRFLGKTNPTGSGYFGLNRIGSAGANSVSVGWHNVANAQSSFAEGEGNTSSGYASHSEGYGNAASGLMAHAEGVTTESSGYGSHSEGVGTIANHIGQHVFGAYNIADASTAQPTAKGNYVEIVGNGTDDNSRRNARTLDWSGNETLMGDLTYNGNKSLTSEISRLDGKIDSKANASDVYTKSQTDNLLNDKADVSDLPDMTQYYDKSEVDDLLDDKANSDDVYGKAYIDTALSGKANVGTSYTKSEEDALLANKADKSDTYTKEQVDDIVYNILPDDTASGSVANFETDLALPIKSLEVDVNAVQSAGTPTPAIPLPISGWSEISLTKCGANLCNQADIVGAYPTKYTLDTDGSIKTVGNLGLSDVLWTNKSKVSGVLNVIFVSKYQNTGSVGIRPKIIYTDGTNSVIYSTNTQEYSIKTLLTTSGKTVDKIVVDYGTNNPTNFFLEVTLDTSANTYEPYNGNTEVINLGGTYYGGHFTQDKAGHRQFVVTYSELYDMGDLTWANFDAPNNIFRAVVTNCKAPIVNSERRNGFLCSIYPPSASVSLNQNMSDKSMLRYNGWLVIRDTEYSDYTELASDLSGGKLIYELATPYVIDLPDGEPITTLVGMNNIFADTGDTSVVFKDSVNGYVEKKIASVQALALNT